MSEFVVAPGMVVHGRDELTHNCDAAGCRPVAVIGYEDWPQVDRLVEAYLAENAEIVSHTVVDRKSMRVTMQAALREFAAPTPPKPAEPQGLGAVVEDAEGKRWVRCPDGYWRGETVGHSCNWAAITAVRVLSEGVK